MKCTLVFYVMLGGLALLGPGGCADGGGDQQQQTETRDPLIPAGTDCWTTECGRTKATFCGPNAIPAGFFEPGSFSFQGDVRLEGATGDADTQVQRHDDLVLGNIGDTGNVEIELVQLDLVSCQPIIVDTNQGPTQWDVEVTLSDNPPPQRGVMTVTKTHDNGGTFVSELVVQPKFIFTKVGDPTMVRVLDTGMLAFPADLLKILGEAPWVHELDPNNSIGPVPPACGSNFVPGVREDPANNSQCCVPICHEGATATHWISVGRDCSGCPSGACCLPNGSCQVVSATMTMTAGEVCAAMGGEYKGDGTDCTKDTDMDGIPDVNENNNCCGPTDMCNFGTNPAIPDTDGDGVPDGTEVMNGTDPCDPNDF